MKGLLPGVKYNIRRFGGFPQPLLFKSDTYREIFSFGIVFDVL